MLTKYQERAAIALYHSLGPVLEATLNPRNFDEVWEVVGAEAFYHALAHAESESAMTGRSIKVSEFDNCHNFIKSEIVRGYKSH
jgi:hypothetical protein